MTDIGKKYYVVSSYSDSNGHQENLIGLFNQDEFEWDPFEPDPSAIEIKKEYVLKISDPEFNINSLDFDFCQSGPICVSRKFLDICEKVGIKYRAIPLIVQAGDMVRKGDFFIFLVGEHFSAIDKSSSIYEISKSIDTGEEIENQIYLGSVNIDRIDFLVVSNEIDSHLFRCEETLEVFCSLEFKLAAENLKGICFSEIDKSYKYDPWESFDSL